jgi:hypothetical protein
MFGHMMDLAPERRDVTARDDTSPVSQRDRSTLVMVEDAVDGLDRDDPAVCTTHHALHSADAGDVPGCCERDRLIVAGKVSDPATRDEVSLAHGHDECGRCAAERGQRTRTRGRRQHDRERVMLLLRVGALVGNDPLWFVGVASTALHEDRPRRAARVEHAVEAQLQLGGDFGEEAAAYRDQPVRPATPDRHTAPAQSPRLGGLGAVLIEIRRPYLRERSKIICARRRCSIRTLTAR